MKNLLGNNNILIFGMGWWWLNKVTRHSITISQNRKPTSKIVALAKGGANNKSRRSFVAPLLDFLCQLLGLRQLGTKKSMVYDYRLLMLSQCWTSFLSADSARCSNFGKAHSCWTISRLSFSAPKLWSNKKQVNHQNNHSWWHIIILTER